MTKEYRIGIAPPETFFEHILDKVLRWLIIPTVVVLGLIIIVMVWAGIIITVMTYISSVGHAQENLPRGLGHPNGPVHWYDTGCCDKRDCEPVEPGAIRQTEQGYYVRYLTSRGFVAEGILPYGHSGIRPSRDGQEHACATTQRVLCIYLPMMM